MLRMEFTQKDKEHNMYHWHPLFEKVESIENAFAHVSELKPPRAAKALSEHYDMAQMSKELAAICVDAPLDYRFEEAKLKNIFTEEAYALFQRLEFKNLLKNFDIEKKDSVIEDTFERKIEKIKKKDIVELCPSISIGAVEKGIKKLLNEGKIRKEGNGKNTFYVKNN